MARSRPWSDANPDLRRRTHVPSPAIEEIEKLLLTTLKPSSVKPLKSQIGNHGQTMRDHLLTLPVMVAIVLSLVCWTIPSLHELCRVLAQEGLLWVKPMKISVEALSKRLQVLPAILCQELLQQVQLNLPQTNRSISPLGECLKDKFPQLWIADGSTLEELRRTLKIDRIPSSTVLGGKMMAIVDLFTHQPVEITYTDDPDVNDKTFNPWLLSVLPTGGLLVFDLGFFSFPWFDEFTQQGKFFITRLRGKTSYRSIKTLSSSSAYRDEIVQLGLYRSHPCLHPLRLVSVFWRGEWYSYLTNVLDPNLI
jgi:hypothetical protein